jgi:hypothetical protein
MSDDWVKAKERTRHRQLVKLWREESEVHPDDCACWSCLLALLGAVARHQAEMKVKREGKRRPMVRR